MKTKFDLLVENILNINEGRKPKEYSKLVMDFPKLEQDVNSMSDGNPFKKLYQYAIDNMKKVGDGTFTDEELATDAKTLPEWEIAFQDAFLGASLSKGERKRFADRFFTYAKDPDREYFSEYVGKSDTKNVASAEENIYNFIKNSDEEKSSKAEIASYMSKYGHDEAEVSTILDKMVEDSQLVKDENGSYSVLNDPSLDQLDDSEMSNSGDEGALKIDAFDDDDDVSTVDSSISSEIDPETANELGIDVNDPFGDKEYFDDNL